MTNSVPDTLKSETFVSPSSRPPMILLWDRFICLRPSSIKQWVSLFCCPLSISVEERKKIGICKAHRHSHRNCLFGRKSCFHLPQSPLPQHCLALCFYRYRAYQTYYSILKGCLLSLFLTQVPPRELTARWKGRSLWGTAKFPLSLRTPTSTPTW